VALTVHQLRSAQRLPVDPRHSGSGRSAARLARLLREQEVGSSNLPAPTTSFRGPTAATAIVLVTVAVFVCAAPTGPLASPHGDGGATYTVRRGDNLTLIARRFGTTVSGLRRANGLQGDLIRVGQTLELARPFAEGGPSGPWAWPVRRPGAVLRPFGPYRADGVLMPRTGVELACAPGTELHAPQHGVVRFSGPLEGYGHLLILEHADAYATVLGPCDPDHLAVGVGTAVLRGDPLGRTASPPDAGTPPYVHLELRRHDEAVSPDRLHR
jgi:murein DD-endopeptidase MepM/ murein hydrolase activator NlpD